MDHPSGIDRRMLARHIGADVDRAAPLLARVLLIREIRGIRYRGDNSLRVAMDMITDCGCAGELAAAGATTRELARALAPTHDVDRDLTTAIAAVKGLNWALQGEANSYANYSMCTAPDVHHVRSRVDQAGKEWDKARRKVRAAVERVPANLGNGEIGSRLLDRAVYRAFRPGLLTQIRYYHFGHEPERAWRRRVAKEFLDAARVAMKRGRVAAVESLADNVRAIRQALIEATPRAWARQAASHLEETAVPVLTRQEPLTANKVTAIRLAALCLAHEPEARRITALGDAFCNIFVGITVLEQRTDAGPAINNSTSTGIDAPPKPAEESRGGQA